MLVTGTRLPSSKTCAAVRAIFDARYDRPSNPHGTRDECIIYAQMRKATLVADVLMASGVTDPSILTAFMWRTARQVAAVTALSAETQLMVAAIIDQSHNH